MTTATPEIALGLPQDPYLVPTTPETPTPLPEIIAALRTISGLDGLTEEEYTWIATHAAERQAPDGAKIFGEGEPAVRMNIILRGEIHVSRRNSGPMAMFVGRAGLITGKLPFSRMKTYGGEGHSTGSSWVLDIHESLFPEMLAAIPSMGQRCVGILLDRVRDFTRMEQQAEKLSALGKLAGNLSHELNNPASAAQRSAASLYGQLRQYGDQKYQLGRLCLSDEQGQLYKDWVTRVRSSMNDITAHRRLNSGLLSETDREEGLTRWLAAHQVPEPWNVASALAENFISVDQLEEFAAVAQPEVLSLAIATFASSLRAERMAETVVDATVRIFDLISAIKSYSYMDQAPVLDVDIAQSLDSTLSMFNSRLHETTVERDFDPALPHVSAYGNELNLVWTALIENALDAMDLTKRPAVLRDDLPIRPVPTPAWKIWDNGPGIDLSRPVLRTSSSPSSPPKAVGSGLGLGLDTAQRIVARHSGFLTVESKPGATCFQVRIPFDQAQAY